MDERRSSDRHILEGKVELRTDVIEPGTMKNISAMGITLYSEAPLHPGTELDVILMDRNVAVKGTVQRIVPSENGKYELSIQFDADASDILMVMKEHAMD